MCPEINTLIKEPLQFRRLKCSVSHIPLVVCITEKGSSADEDSDIRSPYQSIGLLPRKKGSKKITELN